MISFFYEGDLNRLGDGILIEKRTKKTPLFSDFLCEMYLNKVKYHAKVRFPRYGGYEVTDILDDKDEALSYIRGRIAEDKQFMTMFVLRWILKFILHFAAISLPVFMILMFSVFSVEQRISSIGFLLIFEPVVYLVSGYLNRI